MNESLFLRKNNKNSERIFSLVSYMPILLFVIAFLSKYLFIDVRDICLDEPYSIFHAQYDLKHIIDLPNKGQPNPPLFMLLLHFWIKWFGYNPESLRLLPLIFNALTPAVLFLIGKKLGSNKFGLIAAFFFILSQSHFLYGLETRTYSMFYLFTALSILSFLGFLENPKSKRNIFFLFLVNTLIIYSHYFGLFVLFTQAVLTVVFFRKREFLVPLFIIYLLCAVMYIPILKVIINQFLHLKDETWLTPPTLTSYRTEIEFFFNGSTGFTLFLCVLLVGFVFRYWILKKRIHLDKKDWCIFFFWFLPYTIMFLGSWKSPMFMGKYIQFTSIGFYLFVGIIITKLFLGNLSLLTLSTGLIGTIMIFNLKANPKNFYYRQPQKAIEAVKDIQEKDSSAIIIIHLYWTDLEFAYYYDRNIFKSKDQIEKMLNQQNIYPVWSVDNIKEKQASFKNRNVIYFQRESEFIDPEKLIGRYLNEKMTIQERFHFPQNHDISYYLFDSIKFMNPSVPQKKENLQLTIMDQIQIIRNDKNWFKIVQKKLKIGIFLWTPCFILDAKWVLENNK